MAIKIEDILTISAGDWFDINFQNPEDYDLTGVHTYSMTNNPNNIKELLENFVKNIPKRAEVVVDYRAELMYSHGYTMAYLYGTALIPR